MSQNWNDFLTAQQISINNGIASTGRSAAEEAHATADHTIISPLTHMGTIQATGNDHRSFLQGQLSNDVNNITPSTSIIAAYCNPKGRMLADFRIIETSAGLQLHCYADILTNVLNRLKMFVLMSEVELEDISNAIQCIGIAGNDSEALLGQHVSSVPTEVNDVTEVSGCHIIRLAGSPARFMISGSVETLIPLWEKLAQDTTIVGTETWNLGDIYSASPHVEAATVETFIPQMLNLHAIDGVSFTKGCYPGQEIVARMRYLGKLKRRMFRLHIDAASAPAVGDDVVSGASQSGQGAGKLVTVSASPAGGYEALAVLEITAAESGDIALKNTDDAKISILSIPYEVPVEKDAS